MCDKYGRNSDCRFTRAATTESNFCVANKAFSCSFCVYFDKKIANKFNDKLL